MSRSTTKSEHQPPQAEALPCAPQLDGVERLRRAVKWVIFFVLCGGSLPRYYRMRCRVLYLLAAAGLYERHELSFLQRVLPRGGTFIDIGAHFGVYSRYAAHTVGPDGEVFSFEPLTPVFSNLTVATQGFPQIRCFRQGISDTCRGTVEFKIPLLFGAIPEPALASVEGCSGYAYTTEAADVLSLDSIRDRFRKVDFIKIDVEGHELACLQGARELLRQHRPLVQFEENSPLQRLPSFAALAAELGYTIATLQADNTLGPVDLLHPPHNERNFYLVPQAGA